MTRSIHTALVAVAALCWQGPVSGQPSTPDPEIVSVRTDFEYANYADALKRASERIDRGNLSETDLVELHKYAGLSAFYLRQKAEAQRHLWALLQLDPDYKLDPFVVPPQAIAYFDGLRSEHAQQLDPIREERRRRAERLKESEDRERARAEGEQQRRQLEELARQASVSRSRPQSFVVNFLPFGAGQFQQGRTKMGIIFASLEGALALTSIGAFFAYNSLLQDQTITLDDRLTRGGTYTVTQHGIAPGREHQANLWRDVKYASAGAFWLTYVVGVIDAIIHHQSEIVPSAAKPSTEVRASSAAADKKPEPGSKIVLQPAFGGLGARVGLNF